MKNESKIILIYKGKEKEILYIPKKYSELKGLFLTNYDKSNDKKYIFSFYREGKKEEILIKNFRDKMNEILSNKYKIFVKEENEESQFDFKVIQTLSLQSEIIQNIPQHKNEEKKKEEGKIEDKEDEKKKKINEMELREKQMEEELNEIKINYCELNLKIDLLKNNLDKKDKLIDEYKKTIEEKDMNNNEINELTLLKKKIDEYESQNQNLIKCKEELINQLKEKEKEIENVIKAKEEEKINYFEEKKKMIINETIINLSEKYKKYYEDSLEEFKKKINSALEDKVKSIDESLNIDK